MIAKNSYPDLPEIPYKKTSIGMPFVVAFAKSLTNYSVDTLRMAYAIFRNESGNGNSGVNNNYAGIQADVGQWNNLPGEAIGTVVKKDGSGDFRRFLAFSDNDGYKISFELLCIKIEQRNIVTDRDYFARWVCNSHPHEQDMLDFRSLLKSAVAVFS